MYYRWGLGLLALAALASTALPTAALTKHPTTVPWPAVGQSLQYLAAADTAPQAALITSVPRPPAGIVVGDTFPTVQVQVFPAHGASFPIKVGYCADTTYPCLVPLP